ncbi:MAG: DNA-directed RNA polymerase subunit alpha [Thermoleophilia bacterium]|nr:DNA-directed RNA polymerase subunit alpha [Thermoleophilia bacterium]
MLTFQVPKITHEQEEENKGIFVVEPLDRGFGHTFGNSLRRVLLSSLEGAAVSLVKIEGVSHEFSTIPGIKEDVTDIVLNLKRLVCLLHGEQGEVEVSLVKSGPGEATAADIEAPSELEIINPDLHIATLGKKAKLEMTITIRRGRGYAAAESNKAAGAAIGVIPVDSNYSPVSRVSYEVDRARVGQRTDFDKLTMEITTDGSMAPGDALRSAAGILISSLQIFTGAHEAGGVAELTAEALAEAPAEAARAGEDEILIEELEIGVRSYNCLKREGIQTVGDLVKRSEAELMNIPNFGRKSIEEVKENLAKLGLSLRGE